METIEILKIVVKNEVPVISYRVHYETSHTGERVFKDPFLIHPDFQEALDKLKPHFALLADLKEGDHVKKKIDQHHEEAFSHVKITGITLSGSGTDRGCCITGTKSIRSKAMPLTTPFEKLVDEQSDDERTGYKFREDLNLDIQRLEHEAKEYINGKNRIGQVSIDFETHAEDME